MSNKLPQCHKCKNFFVTYEPARPYGCRAMGFKSKRLPAIVVYQTSGIACQLFAPKNPPKQGGEGSTNSSWVA